MNEDHPSGISRDSHDSAKDGDSRSNDDIVIDAVSQNTDQLMPGPGQTVTAPIEILQSGETLPMEGADISVGENGTVTIIFPNGGRLILEQASGIRVERPAAGQSAEYPVESITQILGTELENGNLAVSEDGRLGLVFDDGGQIFFTNSRDYAQVAELLADRGDVAVDDILKSVVRLHVITRFSVQPEQQQQEEPQDEAQFLTEFDPGDLPPGLDSLGGLPNEILTFGVPDQLDMITGIEERRARLGDDGPPGPGALLSINDVVVDESAGTATFIVTRSGDVSGPAQVDFTTADGTALAGADYGTSTGTLSFAAGEVAQTIVVDIVDDALAEPDEAFTVELSNAQNATIVDDTGVGVIRDDDSPAVVPRLYVDDVVVQESDGFATFTITRFGDLTNPTSVDFATADGSALAGADYTASTGTVNFAAGEATQTVVIAITDDAIPEPLEAFQLNLSNAANGLIVDNTGVGQIADDDGPPPAGPLFAIDSVTVNETDGFATFTVTRTGDLSGASTVDFQTADGSALAGADYGASTGTLSFAAGEASQEIVVTITDDAIFEGVEQFTVNLSNPTNANVGVATGVGTILDDDGIDAISDMDMTRLGGNETQGNVITGDEPDADPVNQGVLNADQQGDAPAFLRAIDHDGVTYALNSAGTGIDITGDPSNFISFSGGMLTIATMLGGQLEIDMNGPNPGFYTYTSPATSTSESDFEVNSDPGFGGAEMFTFGSGITVSAIDEDGSSTPELLFFNSGGATGIGVGSDNSSTDKIFQREALQIDLPEPASEVVLSLADMPAGDARRVRWTVEGEDANGDTVIFQGDFQGIGAGQEPNDYVINQAELNTTEVQPASFTGPIAIARVTLDSWSGNDPDFGHNTNESSFVVHGVSATTDGPDMETFAYTLEDQSGNRDTADLVVKLKPGEPAPEVIIGDAMAVEGQPLVFDVLLTEPGTSPITLDLETVSGTATDGIDYENTGFEVSTDGGATWIAAGGADQTQITFAAGDTDLKVRIDSFDDTIFEGDETFSLTVGSVVSGTVGDTSDTGTGLIKDNDSPLTDRLVINEIGIGVGTPPGGGGGGGTPATGTGTGTGGTVPGTGGSGTTGGTHGTSGTKGTSGSTGMVGTGSSGGGKGSYGSGGSHGSWGAGRTGSGSGKESGHDHVNGGNGGDGSDFVELLNTSASAITTAELAEAALEIVGPDGVKVVVDLGSLDPQVSIPAGGFLVVYEDGSYRVSDGSGGETSGTWTDTPFSWGFGEDTSKALAVNLIDGINSIDAFIANGALTGDLTGSLLFEGRTGTPGQAAATSILGAVAAELIANADFNGQIGNQQAVLDGLGVDRPLVGDSPAVDPGEAFFVFARTFAPDGGAQPIDGNTVADWTVSNEPTDLALNNAPGDINPQDPADDVNPAQGAGTNDAFAAQTILDASLDGQNLTGGRGPDFIYGDARTNMLRGGDHNDFLFGGEGNDVMFGEHGADLLIDVAGRDLMIGGSGDDIIIANAARFGHPAPANDYGDIIVGDNVAELQQFQFNTSFVIDVSGSMGWGFDGDRSPAPGESRLDIAKAAFKTLVQDIINDGVAAVTALQIVAFNGGVREVRTFERADDPDIITFIDSLSAGGATQYEGALTEAAEWLQADIGAGVTRADDHTNVIYFLSDGGDNNGYNSSVPGVQPLYNGSIPSLTIRAFGFGSAGASDFDPDELDEVVTGIDGDQGTPGVSPDFAVIVDDPSDLEAALRAGSVTSEPTGSDVIYGSDYADIIFGDNIALDAAAFADFQADPAGFDLEGFVRTRILEGPDVPLFRLQHFDGKGDWIDGGAGDDIIFGQGGMDEIRGGAGNDLIFGGAGNDWIEGGAGADEIWGNQGSDMFIQTSADIGWVDTYEDFETGAGGDTLVLKDVLAGFDPASSDANDFVRVVDDGTDTMIQIDQDGAGGAGMFMDLAIMRDVTGFTLDDLLNNGNLQIDT